MIVCYSGPNATLHYPSEILNCAKLSSESKYGTINFIKDSLDFGFLTYSTWLSYFSSSVYFIQNMWTVPLSLEHAMKAPVGSKAMENIMAYSLPLRSSWSASPVLVLNILITVPFYDAVANLFPFGVSYLIKMFTIYGIGVESAYAHIYQRQMCLTTL